MLVTVPTHANNSNSNPTQADGVLVAGEHGNKKRRRSNSTNTSQSEQSQKTPNEDTDLNSSPETQDPQQRRCNGSGSVDRSTYNPNDSLDDSKIEMNWSDGIFLLLAALVILPYLAVIWNSMMSDTGILATMKIVLIQSFWISVFTLAILFATRVYLSRQNLMTWTLDQLNESLTLPVLLDDSLNMDQSEISTQTDERGDVTEMTSVKKLYQSQLKYARRQYLQLKRNFAKRFAKMKDSKQVKADFLTKLQLKIPDMEKKVDLLLAEKEAIEKQFEEEKRRNRELIGRFQRLQQQLGRVGQQRHTTNYH